MSRRAYRPYGGKRKHPVRNAILALILAGILAYGALLGVVLAGAHDQFPAGEDAPTVMIVLGCQVKPWGPSILLQDRLDEALAYLESHPEMTVVVSGGQGPDEHISEAKAMADYFIAQGIDEVRILLEDQSHNTWQNLNYSYALLVEQGMEDQLNNVLVVSNGFHLTRVRMLFDRIWGEESTLSTLSAPTSHVPSRLKMYVREPLALGKSLLLDR